jgi:hypothetical protein
MSAGRSSSIPYLAAEEPKSGPKSEKDFPPSKGSKLIKGSRLSAGDGQFERMARIQLSIASCNRRIEKGDYPTEKQRLADIERLSQYHAQLAVMSLCDYMITESRMVVDHVVRMKFR